MISKENRFSGCLFSISHSSYNIQISYSYIVVFFNSSSNWSIHRSVSNLVPDSQTLKPPSHRRRCRCISRWRAKKKKKKRKKMPGRLWMRGGAWRSHNRSAGISTVFTTPGVWSAPCRSPKLYGVMMT